MHRIPFQIECYKNANTKQEKEYATQNLQSGTIISLPLLKSNHFFKAPYVIRNFLFPQFWLNLASYGTSNHG